MPNPKTTKKPAVRLKSSAAKRKVTGSVVSSSPFSLRRGIFFALIFALIGVYAIFQSFANTNSNSIRAFEEKPERGLVWAGLRSGKADSLCGKLLEVANGQSGEATGCTHGPDPAPEGVDIRKSVDPLPASELASTDGSQSAGTVACDGDGQTGYRVQAIYARSSDRADRFPTYASSFQTYAANTSAMFERSAQQTGDTRKLRYVTDAACNVDIKQVVMSTTGDDNFSNMTTELKNQGFNLIDRKYMVWVDANVYCGIGSIWNDDKPTQDNLNNGNASTYGRSDAGCWNYAEGHELMHNLGGVQLSAPNTSGGWHCTDESDNMCYDDDGSGPVAMRSICSGDQESSFDCQKNDYFNTRPAAGSYLDTKWNASNTRFLIGSTVVAPTDTTAPTVQLTSPANGSTISGTSSVAANAGDNVGVSRVDFFLNGNLLQSDTTASYFMSFDTTRYANGSYQFSARAYDAAGNSTVSSVHTVTISNTTDIDTTAPTVSISSPLANSTIPANGRVSISASATDNRNVTKMEVYIDARLTTTTTSGSVSTSWNAKRATSGYHTIMVKAYDAAGNMAQTQVNVFKP